MGKSNRKSALMLAGSLLSLIGVPAMAASFNIPRGTLAAALDAYSAQSGVPVAIATRSLGDVQTKGVVGEMPADQALTKILSGTGFSVRRVGSSIAIVRAQSSEDTSYPVENIQIAQAAPPRSAVETVTVTSSKLGGSDVQSVPIAITALSQEQLTATQTTGGPDLIKQVPNMTFTKTNFSGYSIQIRGIGTQAISVTTDPAVAVAFNDIPFIRNHFFEQEFYDVASVEVARGPQGTLYGRNATAGVVNLISAKATDQFEAMASADIGNYHNRRFEAMVNIPIVNDKLDLRVAGEWTKRQGYSLNDSDSNRIDGRDLWSGRLTVGMKPVENLQMNLIWEHFSEDDDRLRSAKQTCKTDPGPGEVGGIPKPVGPISISIGDASGDFFSQGCLPTSLYSPQAYESPLGYTLAYITGAEILNVATNIDPYVSRTQSSNPRVIESGIDPIYKAKNDVVELNADYNLTPALTATSQTGFAHDFLYSAEDYNRFGSAPGFFIPGAKGTSAQGVFCDPQLGCSDRLIAEDLSQEHAWQLSQELRIASNFSGPINFNLGGNYLHYETEENYYVFSNSFTLITAGAGGGFAPPSCTAAAITNWIPGVSDNSECLPNGFQFNDPTVPATISGGYIDPNPLSHLNNNGHNYFLSQNPYVLNSYAVFGEVSYYILDDLKLTAGLRWTDDQKHFVDIPSWLVSSGWGYPILGAVDQQWGEFTGRGVATWNPKLRFTDQTLMYASYSHGYKAGGANPPGAVFSSAFAGSGSVGNAEGSINVQPTHPLTFKPEFVDAFELGTKNTLLDGSLTVNGDFFYYNYENYQISQIVDRTAINLNFDAHVKGAELEATWEPLPGLRFNFSGGWEATAIAQGQSAVDLMDRTAGRPGWYVVKPFLNEASNCIFPTEVAKFIQQGSPVTSAAAVSYCAIAYDLHLDPLTALQYVASPTQVNTNLFPPGSVPPGYAGFDPSTAPNNGAGFAKNLGGNSLPNSPPYTASFGAQYTVPLSSEWASTLRSDFYWQDASWWRVFNDLSYDRLHGYHTVNLTLILTSQSGWQVMLYDKNVFNTTAITGAFLNSDDSGLTTNVFLTDPKLIGVRVTKNW